MEFKENLILNEEEKEKLECTIDWYNEYWERLKSYGIDTNEDWERLKSYGIDTNEDLFYIILSVLRENEKNS